MVKSTRKTLSSKTKKKWLSILQTSAEKKRRGATHPELKIVIDTNVFYSAFVSGGVTERVLVYCMDNTTIVLSDGIIGEIKYLLRDDLKMTYRWRKAVMQSIEAVCEVVDTGQAHIGDNLDAVVVRDPKDEHVVEAALRRHCDVIITGDKDLLSDGTYESTSVLSPSEFVELVVDEAA